MIKIKIKIKIKMMNCHMLITARRTDEGRDKKKWNEVSITLRNFYHGPPR